MKLLEISLSILLIPVMVAGQDQPQLSSAAKALLKKPRLGVAEIAWQNGTVAQMNIVRVTDRFMSVDQGGTCQNVELSRIAKVKWPRLGVDREGLSYLIAIAPMIPYLLVEQGIASLDSKLGSWESIRASSNRTTEQVNFTSGGEPGKGALEVRQVFIRTGRYRAEGEKLYTRYDGDDLDTSVGVRFECNKLIFAAVPAILPMTAQPRQGRAEAPIVGRWVAGYGDTGPSAREFHADGTFQIEWFQRAIAGGYERAEGGVNVFLNGPRLRKEKWQIRTTNGSLFITRDGKTTEFRRRPPLY